MRKKLLVFILFLMPILISTCSKKSTVSKDLTLFGMDKQNNIKVDKENKKIKIFAVVNGKYLLTNTRHAVISETGKFADKAIFKAFTKPSDFHKALIDIGAVAGNNMTEQNATSTLTEGSKLKVTFTWKGQEKGKDINEVIIDSNKNPIDIRFTGNLERSNNKNTGCLTCLDSCLVGISSNHTYPYGSVEKEKKVEFRGNAKVLPSDGEAVIINYEVVK